MLERAFAEFELPQPRALPQDRRGPQALELREARARDLAGRAVSEEPPREDPQGLRTSPVYTPSVIERDPGQGRARALPDPRLRDAPRREPLPSLDDLTFLPASLTRIPLEGYRERCVTTTVLGTRFAEQPIELDIPIMITGHELRRAVAQRQGRARARREPGRQLHDVGRRRDAPRRARELEDDDRRGPAQPLRRERPPPAPGRRHRADDRPGREAGHRRPAARLEGVARDRRASATCRPASTSDPRRATRTSSARTT